MPLYFKLTITAILHWQNLNSHHIKHIYAMPNNITYKKIFL